MRTNDTDIGLLVSEDIWEMMKNIVIRLQAHVLGNPEVDLCNHSIISERGILAYGTQTYDPFTRYLKCLHITIDSWRHYIDIYGCKVVTIRLKSEKVTEA